MRHVLAMDKLVLYWALLSAACIPVAALAQPAASPSGAPAPGAAERTAQDNPIGSATDEPAAPAVVEQATPATAPAAEPAPVAEPVAAQPEGTPSEPDRLAALEAEVAAIKAQREDAELNTLLEQAEDAQDIAQADPLRLYGFMDFGVDKWFVKDSGVGLLRPTGATTFVFGNLNLYLDATPVERVRALVELRFTLAPNGEEVELGPPIGTSYERLDTTIFDYSSPSSQSPLPLSGIFIERAWAQYSFSDLLNVQWGLILTPFGIWNLDHGSPTLISLMLPTFISARMVPTRLLGVHAYGSVFSGPTEYGYALHISNGRTPADFDLSEDKGIGGRLFVANEGNFGRLVLGASGYFGSYLDREKRIIPVVGASLDDDGLFEWATTVEYAESVLGLDAALDMGGLRIRSEGILRWVDYEAGQSERISAPDGSEQYLPNRLEWAGYVIAAYRTPWKVEPYLEVELASKSFTLPQWAKPAQATSPNFALLLMSAGVNVELTGVTLLKVQVLWGRTYDRDFQNHGLTIPVFFSRIVTSF